MIKLAEIFKKIEKFKSQLGGVFTYTDLFHLIGSADALTNRRIIKRLLAEKVLYKVRRGFYVTESPDLWLLATRIKPQCYISMDSILSKNGLIGSMPQGSVSAIYPGSLKEEISTPFGLIRFFSIKKNLVFGTSSNPKGIKVANNEKAYLDLLYYHNRGTRFTIDPLNEVEISKLNQKILFNYLTQYQNPKFTSFVRRLIHEFSN